MPPSPESTSDGAPLSRTGSLGKRGHRNVEELRRVLLRPDRKVISDLKRRVAQLEVEQGDLMAEEVSQLLPEAVRMNTTQAEDDGLPEALAPTIEQTLHASVERNPQPLVDALFPVIGPAIRKSVSEALNKMLTNMNQTIEHSVSWQGLRWRWEAWRTGRAFADVVLRHTLLFRVEQLFLIDRETGLPMQHLTAEAVEAEDGALVSGMLTAIQDFVHDSFELEDEEQLQDFSVGELSVWVNHGPQAALAAVIRGTPDPRLREVMHQVTERVHHQFRDALVHFDGDADDLEEARPVLEQALLVQREAPSSRPSPILWVVLAALLLGLGWWGWQSWQTHQDWTTYRSRLDAAPGIVVTETATAGGRWTVHGLRDPLAPDPDSILDRAALDTTQVQTEWRPYRSLEPAVLMRRAQHAIEKEVVLFQEADVLQDGQQVVLDRLATHILDLHQATQAVGEEIELQVRGHHSKEGSRAVNKRLARARATLVQRRLRKRGVPDAILRPVEAVGAPINPELAGTDEGKVFNRGVTLRVELIGTP